MILKNMLILKIPTTDNDHKQGSAILKDTSVP